MSMFVLRRILLSLFVLLATGEERVSDYFTDWGNIGGRPNEVSCVNIPKNMSLCAGIDYNMMRLPNLLQHDTLKEAQQQSGYWIPLINLQCHPSTQLFLCSLFSPVCLEISIYPCRSLCEAVQKGCEERMTAYSFPWPDMLRCDKFPLDNDMCLRIQSPTKTFNTPDSGDCEVCRPIETYENILDNFCRADVVVKARLKGNKKSTVSFTRAKVLKASPIGPKSKKYTFSLTSAASCCKLKKSSRPYLVMAKRHHRKLVPNFVMSFKKSRSLSKAMKMFSHLNCSDPELFARRNLPELVVTHQNKRREGKKSHQNFNQSSTWTDGSTITTEADPIEGLYLPGLINISSSSIDEANNRQTTLNTTYKSRDLKKRRKGNKSSRKDEEKKKKRSRKEHIRQEY